MSFPSTIDDLTNVTATEVLGTAGGGVGVTSVINALNTAVEAVEAKVGADSSAVTTSHDYKLSGVTGTDKATSLTGTETLTNKTLTSPTMTTPTLGVATVTTVNKVTVTAPTTSATLTLAQGSSLITSGAYAITLTSTAATNVTLPTTGTLATLAGTESLSNKTLTKPTINASVQGTVSYTPSASATQDLDCSADNVHLITMPAGNITLTVSNVTAGQFFYVRILQDGTGSRTVTWFSTITWAGAGAPTLTTTGSRADLFAFFAKTASTFDGFVVGSNIG